VSYKPGKWFLHSVFDLQFYSFNCFIFSWARNTSILQLQISAKKIACIDNTKHSKSQIPTNSYWTFSCNIGLKNSVAYFSTLLLSLEILLHSTVGQKITCAGRSALFVRVHKLLWLPLFVSIMLSMLVSSNDVKPFLKNSRITSIHENHFKENIQDLDRILDAWSFGLPQFLIIALPVQLSHFLEC